MPKNEKKIKYGQKKKNAKVWFKPVPVPSNSGSEPAGSRFPVRVLSFPDIDVSMYENVYLPKTKILIFIFSG